MILHYLALGKAGSWVSLVSCVRMVEKIELNLDVKQFLYHHLLPLKIVLITFSFSYLPSKNLVLESNGSLSTLDFTSNV